MTGLETRAGTAKMAGLGGCRVHSTKAEKRNRQVGEMEGKSLRLETHPLPSPRDRQAKAADDEFGEVAQNAPTQNRAHRKRKYAPHEHWARSNDLRQQTCIHPWSIYCCRDLNLISFFSPLFKMTSTCRFLGEYRLLRVLRFLRLEGI